jgi:tetratricopeptide (TPR) repeat protein
LCLNCGNRYTSNASDAQCGACGLGRQACTAALEIADAPAEPIAAARAAFSQGLFRRGIALLNSALQDGAFLLEAWFLKARFLNSLGFNRTAAGMLDGALARHTSAADRIGLLEEQSFLWAEAGSGEEAFASADAAATLGSNSVRTQYLRGRALALLGRLEEAREKMNDVLALDPLNADAQRGLNMINSALQPSAGKRWWQFWKHQ